MGFISLALNVASLASVIPLAYSSKSEMFKNCKQNVNSLM